MNSRLTSVNSFSTLSQQVIYVARRVGVDIVFPLVPGPAAEGPF